MRCRAIAVALLAAAATGCGAPSLMKLPAGGGTPAPDAADALDQATTACRAIRTWTAEIGVSGKVAGRRVRATLSAGLAAPDSARLEAVAPFGSPLFILVSAGNDATVLLPRDGRVLAHAPAGAVLDAIAGVPLDAADLRMVVTGCAPPGGSVPGRAFGDAWRVVSTEPATDAYLHRESPSSSWRVVALVKSRSEKGRGWRADFAQFAAGLPQRITVANADEAAAGESFALQLALSQVETNVPLDAEVFRVRVPADAVPMTLEELRSSGPLGEARSEAPRAR